MKPLEELMQSMQDTIELKDDRILIKNERGLPDRMNSLIHEAVFGSAEAKAAARWLIWETAQALGIRPASIHELYLARGRGEIQQNFTVPAMNIRMLTYDSVCAALRAVRKLHVGAVIFEIARSEIGYTDQRPGEYVATLLAAAIKEGYRGPVFIQGDHFQINAKKYAADPAAELKAVQDLISEAVPAGFLNIDIDTSTLVDLSKLTITEQQRSNFELCAQLTQFVRSKEPKGATVSIGGEIGEVGGKNSTVEEMRAFMDGYVQALSGSTHAVKHAVRTVGMSKISIQTGTSHGGVVLPDGKLADIAIDFDVLKRLGQAARESYKLGGAVQHGASTLPENAFSKFVDCQAVEVHLATAFQTMVFDHPAMPVELRLKMIEWVKVNAADERKATDTEEQFIYKSRKKAIGPFKRELWMLPSETREAISRTLEDRFTFLYRQLNVGDTEAIVAKFVHPTEWHQPLPTGALQDVEQESVEGLAD
jgi:fructose/tagatose bisphosphate aldolase